jgi:hypothetical protein
MADMMGGPTIGISMYPRHNADLLVSLVFGVKGTGVKELYLKIGI